MRVPYILFIFVAFVLSLPLQMLIALVLWMSQGLPILYLQKRVGKKGLAFTLFKFRTMRLEASGLQKLLEKKNESDGPTFKIHNDPRFTHLGKFLSHTGLDELPQLWNVLRGDMALIGPRPLPVAEAKKLTPWMRARHNVLPGIISPAILTGRYHQDFNAWMKNDVVYAQQKNIVGDITLVLQSTWFLLKLFVRSSKAAVASHS